MSRGYVAIALHNPKTPANIGAVLRAAGCYAANLVVIGGKRGSRTLTGISTDTQKAWKHIPTLDVEDVFDVMPLGAIPIAVDLVEGAISLPRYVHPERAFYVFGPEDGTLGGDILRRCRDRIMVPTSYCMNLAATVNVILYDRRAKQ